MRRGRWGVSDELDILSRTVRGAASDGHLFLRTSEAGAGELGEAFEPAACGGAFWEKY